MRSTSLPKSVLVAVLGCLVLSGCGTRSATTDQTPAGSAVAAATPLGAGPGADDPEIRFLELITRIPPSCYPNAPEAGDGKGDVPKPEDLPGWEGGGSPTPEYGPGETPPGVPNAEDGIPVPLVDDPAPPEPTPGAARPKPVEEVPLVDMEKCSGSEHAKRISAAFENVKTTGYQEMHEKLQGLGYPASRIHRMPNHAGAPRARLDLRFMGGHLALEVTGTGTGTGSGVTVEAFGASEEEHVQVTEVERKPKPDAPAS
ncbi:hypothetical protein [Streptomyces sp. NPDC059874]|uniref:hypothetical protein n=1 Tax=Streptomyces sp. NPDC059874 TaxID=3346983 RepID=UPI00366160B4